MAQVDTLIEGSTQHIDSLGIFQKYMLEIVCVAVITSVQISTFVTLFE